MRINLVFHYDGSYPIPFNRNYAISSWIYRCINFYNREYSEILHFDRDIKLFVFSDLYIPKYRVSKEGIFTSENDVSFYLSSPRSEFISNLVKGLLNDIDKNTLTLRNALLKIKSIETLRSIEFADSTLFKALSPIVTSTFKEGKIYYLSPDKEKFYENLKTNLRKKYLMVHGKQYKKEINIEPIYEKFPRKIKYSIEIKKGHVIGFKIPLKIIASNKLLETAYECGIGEKNSQGFGMLDVYKKI